MDHHFARDVDETSSNSPYSESRCQQLGREKCQLVGVSGLLESVVPEKDWQAIDPLLPKTFRVKDDLKDGIFCTLCYIVTPNNSLMEQHLIGPAHLTNVQAQMCRENNKPKRSFSNETVKATTSNVEVGSLGVKSCCSKEIDQRVMEDFANSDTIDISNETVKATTSDVEVSSLGNKSYCSREIDQRVMEDFTNGDTIDIASVVMKNKDIKNEMTPAQNETAKEERNTGCEICKYFEGVEYQIPGHYCLNAFQIPSLPAGWAVKTSRTFGWTFYINIVTNETQWDFPSEPAVDELPKGWAVKRAKCNGLPFYVNQVTNDWQWDHPTSKGEGNIVDVTAEMTLR